MLMLVTLVTAGSVDVIALETDETVFSDGNLNDEKDIFDDNGTDEFQIEENIDEIHNASDVAGHKTNKIELNQYYNISDLIADWGYLLELNIPEAGRIKIRIEDCNVDKIDTSHYLIPDDGATSSYYDPREWDVVTDDSLDSGWISVQKGMYYPRFYHKSGYDQTINREAKFIVEYQRQGEFYGEVEPNDSYDDATFIQNNILYEGNYSKYNDIDIYKFHMDNPGRVEISIRDKSQYIPYYWLYEEDEYGNIYEIKNLNRSRIRLGVGNYYIKADPWRNKNQATYTLETNVVYESADSYEQEPNNVKSMANDKQTNIWYTGNLNTKDDIDYYKFTVDKSGKIKLELKIPRQVEGMVVATLYDSNLNKLDSLQSTSNPYITTKEKKYPEGTYYVRVENADDRSFEFLSDYAICLSQEKYKYVKQITLPENLKINTGERYTLNPQILPSDAENPKLIWSSSDNNVVTVNSNGVVTGKGDGTAVITAKAADGSGIECSTTISVETVKKDIQELDVVRDVSYTYTGKPINPYVDIIDGKKRLAEGVDYTISCKKNIGIGTALITITGIGNYTGVMEESFDIVPRDITINSVKTAGKGKLKISWKKTSGIDGYILYRSTSQDGDYKRIKTIKNPKVVNYTDSSLKNGTKYYYIVEAYKIVDGGTIFSSLNSKPKGAKTLGTTPKVNVVGTYRGKATITVYKKGSIYYAKAYGRGGKMNTTVRLYSYSGGYKAYYNGKNSDVFFTISNISSKRAKITFPYVSEFSGWYSR